MPKIKRFVTNPRTARQQLNRQKFAVSTLRWQNLKELEKEIWRANSFCPGQQYAPGSFYPRYWGYHNFIADFMRKN